MGLAKGAGQAAPGVRGREGAHRSPPGRSQRCRAAAGGRLNQADHPTGGGRWIVTKVIEIVVSPTGQSTLTTKGFWGTGCREASRLIEHALGQKTEERLT